MIIGLTGAICSGKKTLAKFLEKNRDFTRVDLIYLFAKKLKNPKTLSYSSPSKKKEIILDEKIGGEDSIETSDDNRNDFDLKTLAPIGEEFYEDEDSK